MSGDGSYAPQSSAGFKAMTVPERIQLSTGVENTGIKSGPYKPMKVPDRITLDDPLSTSSATVAPPTAGDGWQERDRMFYSQEPAAANRKPGEPATNRQKAPNPQSNTEISTGIFPDDPDDDVLLKLQSLEERVGTLESRMDRVKSSGLNRFWYVVTFSSWMMVPLAVVFMFYYRRNS